MSLTPEEQGMIGGSDLAAILGLSPYRTPLQVYARIVAGEKDADSAPKRRGRALEDAVLGMYLEETGATLLGKPKLKHPRLVYTRASLDGIVERGGGRRVAEVKTAGLSEVRNWGEVGTDAIPQGYLYQVAWYAGVALATGAVDTGEVDVAALVAGDLRVYHVPHDAELFGLLEEAVERFWMDYVESRRPPPVTEPLRDIRGVAGLFRSHSGDAKRWTDLAPTDQLAVEEYLRARREETAATRLRAAWEVRVKLALGAAPQLVGLPPEVGATRLDWKKSKSRMVTDWEACAKALEPHVSPSEYVEVLRSNTTPVEGARPFNVRGEDE
jgi:putative phage-type endonuclease